MTDKEKNLTGKTYFVRLNYSERMQHMIFFISFLVLGVTGFMVKTPEEVVIVLGSAGEMIFMFRSLLHRIAGVIMILISIYHIYYLISKPAGRRWIVDMRPTIKDLKDIAATYLYYMGIKEKPPESDRFCYKHKIEYVALVIGSILMSVTGLMLWTEYRWSKFLLDVSTVVHLMQSILACLTIIIWHLYEVQWKPRRYPIDNMWLTGVMVEEEMKEKYPLQYKKIMANPELQKIYIKRGNAKN